MTEAKKDQYLNHTSFYTAPINHTKEINSQNHTSFIPALVHLHHQVYFAMAQLQQGYWNILRDIYAASWWQDGPCFLWWLVAFPQTCFVPARPLGWCHAFVFLVDLCIADAEVTYPHIVIEEDGSFCDYSWKVSRNCFVKLLLWQVRTPKAVSTTCLRLEMAHWGPSFHRVNEVHSQGKGVIPQDVVGHIPVFIQQLIVIREVNGFVFNALLQFGFIIQLFIGMVTLSPVLIKINV